MDIRDILPSIRVPTLILNRTGDPVAPIEAVRYMAARISDARLIEFPGDTHGLSADPEDDEINDAVQEFVTGERPAPRIDRVLTTVLFTDIVGSTEKQASLGDRAWNELLGRHHAIVRDALERWRGVENDTAGDGFYATFDGPARAVRCALDVIGRVRELDIEIRAGVHTGECEVIDGKHAGLAVTIGARIASDAGSSEVLISRTVKDLTAGSGFTFEDAGEHELKGVPDRWHLYRVMG
jgi:class 3 adenylate cyclase